MSSTFYTDFNNGLMVPTVSGPIQTAFSIPVLLPMINVPAALSISALLLTKTTPRKKLRKLMAKQQAKRNTSAPCPDVRMALIKKRLAYLDSLQPKKAPKPSRRRD